MPSQNKPRGRHRHLSPEIHTTEDPSQTAEDSPQAARDHPQTARNPLQATEDHLQTAEDHFPSNSMTDAVGLPSLGASASLTPAYPAPLGDVTPCNPACILAGDLSSRESALSSESLQCIRAFANQSFKNMPEEHFRRSLRENFWRPTVALLPPASQSSSNGNTPSTMTAMATASFSRDGSVLPLLDIASPGAWDNIVNSLTSETQQHLLLFATQSFEGMSKEDLRRSLRNALQDPIPTSILSASQSSPNHTPVARSAVDNAPVPSYKRKRVANN